jgi:hypothetical protein
MKIGFRAPELTELDHGGRDLLALFLFSDERPLRGVAGLADWRLNSRIALEVAQGRFHGQAGEAMLMPSFGRLPFRGVLLLGLGPMADFTIIRFREAIQRHLASVMGVQAQRFAAPLPPWRVLRMRPTQAIEFWITEMQNLLLHHRDLDLDALLFEEPEAQRAMMDPLLSFLKRYA